MMEEKEREEFKKGMRTTWIFWAHMFFSLFAYITICHHLRDKKVFILGPGFPVDLLRNILYGVAIAEVLFTYYYRRFMLTVRSYKSEEKLIRHAFKSNRPPFIAKYNIAVLVSLASSEMIGINGVVLFFLGDGFQTLYNFIAISGMTMLFFRPKMKELQQLSIAMRGLVLRFQKANPFYKNAGFTPC